MLMELVLKQLDCPLVNIASREVDSISFYWLADVRGQQAECCSSSEYPSYVIV